jgi:hypothetical protein
MVELWVAGNTVEYGSSLRQRGLCILSPWFCIKLWE